MHIENGLKYHLTYSSKNKRTTGRISDKKNNKSNKNILQNLTNPILDNIIMNINSSSSTKKERININQEFRHSNPKINFSNLKLKQKDKKSSDILNTLFKGIISLKKNDIFDYIIKMLKLMLYYYKRNNTFNNINNGNGNNFGSEIIIDDNNYLDLLYQNIFHTFSKETIVRNILMKDFNKNKKIFKNIHYLFIYYIYCGIEHIFQ